MAATKKTAKKTKPKKELTPEQEEKKKATLAQLNARRKNAAKNPITENLKKIKTVNISSADVDKDLLNDAVNLSLSYLNKQLKSRKTKASVKKEIALKLATKAMPNDMVLTDKDGNSFLSAMKELHGKGNKRSASKVEE